MKTKKAGTFLHNRLFMGRGLSLLLLGVLLCGAVCRQPAKTAAQAVSAGADLPQDLLAAGYVVPCGNAFGVKMLTDGVIITDFSDLYAQNRLLCPAKKAGLQTGDRIVAVNGEKLAGNAALAAEIAQSGGRTLTLTVQRAGKTLQKQLTPVKNDADGTYAAGMWVRDSAAGVGTVTFYDSQSGVFAALGHGICDKTTGEPLCLSKGEIGEVKIGGVNPASPGAAGELRGYFVSDTETGALLTNTDSGVYGIWDTVPDHLPDAVPVASRYQVHTGPAQILCTVDENGVQAYEVVIERVNTAENECRNMVVHVTDEALLEKTGGIVQGMSGSPLLQDGRLIGAVTHVFLGDCTRGYGILASTMLQNAQALAEEENVKEAS